MINIKIENLYGKEIDGEAGKSLLQNLQEHYIDWMHACGAKGRCTSCKAIIINGGHCLTELSKAEKRFVNLGKLAENERLSCQAELVADNGALVVRFPRIYQLPHQKYSD